MLNFFILYSVAVYLINLTLNIRSWVIYKEPKIYDDSENASVTIIVPAYNEEVTIIDSVESMMKQSYKNCNVIVVNDGSNDNTLGKLINHFKLISCHLSSTKGTSNYKPIKQVFYGKGLLVLDKPNGGKADALNAGFAYSNTDWILSVDGDTMLSKDCVKTLVSKRQSNADAVSSMVGISNGVNIDKPSIPKGFWARVQWMEYNRSYTLLRTSLLNSNCVTVIAGACSFISSKMIEKTGGYKHNNLGEDMEHTLNIHSKGGKIQFLPEVLSWTEAPSNLRDLGKQRVRWFRGGFQSYSQYLKLIGKPNVFGVFMLPYIWLVDLAGAWVELIGLGLVGYTLYNHSLDVDFFFIWWGIIIAMHFSNFLIGFLFLKKKLKLYESYKGIWYLALIEGISFHYLYVYWMIKAHVLELFGFNRKWNKLNRKGF